MKTWKTPKGTELPILDMRGKDYLQVAHRLVWFREEHPDWGIDTRVEILTPDSAIGRAAIKDPTGRVIATATKFEDRKGFGDFIEKCETGAVGRALAMCGFGTQFCADELEEGERLADSPLPVKLPTPKPSMKNEVIPNLSGMSQLSEAQLKRLYAISKKHFWKPDQVKEHMAAQWGVKSAQDLTRAQYDLLIADIERSSGQ